MEGKTVPDDGGPAVWKLRLLSSIAVVGMARSPRFTERVGSYASVVQDRNIL